MDNEKNISVVGISYRTSTLEEFESLQIPRKDISKLLQTFREQNNIEGIVLLSTCNRLEFYVSHSFNSDPQNKVFDIYSKYKNLNINSFKNLFYVKSGRDAIKHLLYVISGLDSLILGEYQIQGQVKEAYSIACQAKTVDKALHKLFHSAFRCGKEVRTATSLGKGRQSVSGLAAKILQESISDNSWVTIVGVNENSKIIATELKKKGFSNFIFVNRTLHKAQALAEEYGGAAYSLESIAEVLPRTDILFTSTSAPVTIIPSHLVKESYSLTGKPNIIIDLAIPRDVDASGLPSEIIYYNIETLKQYLERENSVKLEDLPFCEKIIEQEVNAFLVWQESAKDDIFEPYAEKFEHIRSQLLEEYSTTLSPETMEKVDKITRQLIHRTKSIFVSILKNGGIK
jgi:glutamyl-tRNA reductase